MSYEQRDEGLARAASAAAKEGAANEVELLLISDTSMRTYRIGPVAARTLRFMLEEALRDLEGR